MQKSRKTFKFSSMNDCSILTPLLILLDSVPSMFCVYISGIPPLPFFPHQLTVLLMFRALLSKNGAQLLLVRSTGMPSEFFKDAADDSPEVIERSLGAEGQKLHQGRHKLENGFPVKCEDPTVIISFWITRKFIVFQNWKKVSISETFCNLGE